jgi:hypothetical protein
MDEVQSGFASAGSAADRVFAALQRFGEGGYSSISARRDLVTSVLGEELAKARGKALGKKDKTA